MMRNPLAAMIVASLFQAEAHDHIPFLPGTGGGYQSRGSARSSGGNGASLSGLQRIKAAKAAKLARRKNRKVS